MALTRSVSGLVTAAPTVLLTGPLVDGFGAGAWNNMRRRTQTMFPRRDEMARSILPNGDYRALRGAVSILVDSLNGMLHPRVELGEVQWKFLDLVPRGTLLEWIDDYLTSPETPLDRTAGKWANMAAMQYIVPKAVRERITLKGFAHRDERDRGTFLFAGVNSHGAFSDSRFGFWRDATWCLLRHRPQVRVPASHIVDDGPSASACRAVP